LGGSSEPNWVFVDDVVYFHDQAIENHGGRHGIRNHGLLHQALTRPERRWYYDGMDNLARIAACYTATFENPGSVCSANPKSEGHAHGGPRRASPEWCRWGAMPDHTPQVPAHSFPQ